MSTNTHQHLLSCQQSCSRDTTAPPGTHAVRVLSCFSHVSLFATPWTIPRQAPLSMGFSRQEYWSGLPQPPPEDLPHPRIKPASLRTPALAGGFFTTSATWEAPGLPRSSLNHVWTICYMGHMEYLDINCIRKLPANSVLIKPHSRSRIALIDNVE